MGSGFPGAAAASGSKTRDPDDDIELPEDITIEDYLSTVKLMCPDLLGGQPCREKTSCYAPSKPCRNYQIGGVSLLFPTARAQLIIDSNANTKPSGTTTSSLCISFAHANQCFKVYLAVERNVEKFAVMDTITRT